MTHLVEVFFDYFARQVSHDRKFLRHNFHYNIFTGIHKFPGAVGPKLDYQGNIRIDHSSARVQRFNASSGLLGFAL